jgi:hypothetical protein
MIVFLNIVIYIIFDKLYIGVTICYVGIFTNTV